MEQIIDYSNCDGKKCGQGKWVRGKAYIYMSALQSKSKKSRTNS